MMRSKLVLRHLRRLPAIIVLLVAVAFTLPLAAAEPSPLKLLFLGDNGSHQPAARFKQLAPAMKERKIQLVYSDAVSDLSPQTLNEYDGLVLYANIDKIEQSHAEALLDFVAKGKGFIPLHCASYCFRNNDEVVRLIGAQFQKHGTGTFRTTIAMPHHPVMEGFQGFESWDETYVHTKHNEKDRIVLEVRREGDREEPWTWIRTHGQGRVFYTAWGHDARTWSNRGFQNLVERGIRWACGRDPGAAPSFADRPEMTLIKKDAKPFEYVEADIPFYPAGKKWGVVETGKRKMQLPLSPQESLKHFVTPAGFEVRLFASEANFQGKPISMNWDAAGRLWVCETVDYPNELQPPGEGRDQIRICEDTNHDGIADKFTVFAKKLSIPTAIAFYRGGAIVQNGIETLYLKDVDGDDRADIRKQLISGWNLGDTHGGVSNFQYGLDNWYWGMQGYNNSEVRLTNGKKVSSFRMGFFRFKLEGEGEHAEVTDLEFSRSTNNNTWGLGFSEEGLVFGSTANGNPSCYMPIPNRYYEHVRGWSSSVLESIADSPQYHPITENIREVDHHGNFTAAAGHALYTARVYPREYWNRTAFVTDPTGHLAATFVLSPEGTGFRSKYSWNLLASNDEWTAPIMAEVGPDGNVWVIDWYNYIVQHNPTPAGFKTGKGKAYESELRDKRHGRIYRVVYTKGRDGSDATDRPSDFSKAIPEQLVAGLEAGNLLWRRHAQRLIVEHGSFAGLPALIKKINDSSVDEIGLNAGVIHALWALHGREAFERGDGDAMKALAGALRHQSAGVRRNAVQVLPKTASSIAAIVDSGILRDASPQVQLAALLAMAEMPPSEEGASAVMEACGSLRTTDPWLGDALIAAAARHDVHFLALLAKHSATQKTPLPANVIAVVAEHYARGVPVDTAPALVASLGEVPSEIAEPLLAGVSKGWPKVKPVPLDESIDKRLVGLLPRLSTTARGHLVNLGLCWGSAALKSQVAEISKAFLDLAGNERAEDVDRIAAARQLMEFRRVDALGPAALVKLITPRSSVEFANGVLEAIQFSEAPEAGATIVSGLASCTPSVRPTAIRVLLGRTVWTKALLDAIDAGTLQLSELSLDQKQSLVNHVDASIKERAKRAFAKGGDLPNPDRQKVVEELLPLTEKSGNAVAGRAVFQKTCVKCHTHSGEGGRIGPDLTGMAVHPKKELLIHIIDPSRSVEGNFRVYTVQTDDGKIYSGLLASESKTAIELIDAEAKKHQILREDIEELVASAKSLMPEGFEKQGTQQDLIDLLEFLTQRGKYLPIPLNKVTTIVSTKGMFNSEDAEVERLVFADWSPKTFEGIPFVLVDPQIDRIRNVIMLNGTAGRIPPKMPKMVRLPCNAPAKAIHFLSGASGWGWPASEKGSMTMIVRLNYANGQSEDHPLINGEHFADYIRRVDVPSSKFAFSLRGQQIRYFAIAPARGDTIESIELIKGDDVTSPVVMAVTVEGPS